MNGSTAYISGGISYTGESKSGIAGSAFHVEDTLRRTHGRTRFGVLRLPMKAMNLSPVTAALTITPPSAGTAGTSRTTTSSWTLPAAGLESENWRAELFVNNVTDERAELHVDTLQYVPKVVTNRPAHLRRAFLLTTTTD